MPLTYYFFSTISSHLQSATREYNKKEFHNKVSEGYTYRSTAIQHFNKRDFDKALKYHHMHLNIAKDIADRSDEAAACASIGTTYVHLGDLEKAVDYHQRHLSISRELGDRSAEANACSNLGSAYYGLNDFTRAIEYFLSHVSIVKELGDKTKERSAYANIAMNYFCLKDFTKAIEYHRLHLGFAKQLGDRHGESSAYANLGIDYASLGNYIKAVQYYKLHVSVVQEIGDRDTEGRAFCNLGIAYRNLGDFKTALGYHEQQLRIAKDLEDKHEEGRAYSSIGSCYRFLGDYKNAVKNYDLDLSVSREVGNKNGEERAYSNLSAVYCYLCDFQKAMDYCQLHLSIAKKVRNKSGEGKAYGRLGDVYHHLSNYEKATEYHKLALRISQELEDKVAESHAYQSLGRDHCAQGDLEKGIAYHQLHLSVAKQMGDESEEGIAHYQLGNAYFSLAEFGKAEDCYNLSVTVFDSLRNGQQSNGGWQGSLRYYHEEANTALWKVLLKQEKINQGLLAAEKGRRQSLTNLMESQYGLRSPDWLVSSGDTETLNDILSSISSTTVFLTVSQRAVHFWVLNREQEPRFVQNEIDIRYLKENVDASLETLKEDAQSSTDASANVKCENRSLDELTDEALNDQSSGKKQSAPSNGRQGDPLRVLHDTVICPIEDLISGNEITFVPDGTLFKAPFAAFKDKYSRYLFERFKIRLIPTLKSLKIADESSKQHGEIAEALLIGDPWVESVCIARKVQKNAKKKKKTKGQKNVEEKRLSQLPAAKKEVEMIASILETEPVIGKRATKAEVLTRLPSVELLHIAAHAKAETGEVALSPASPIRSSEKPKEEDYLLTMKDVKDVTMQAKLVVLSCCHSGRGEIKSGSVIDFARALLRAGAGSVMASLWATSDEATHTFMRNFYNHLVEGVSVGTCLNHAMKVMRESDSFSSAGDWAPFILIGDDVTLDFGRSR